MAVRPTGQAEQEARTTYTTPKTMGRVCWLAPVGFWQTGRVSSGLHEVEEEGLLSSSEELARSRRVLVMRCMACLPLSTTLSNSLCCCFERCKCTCEGSFMIDGWAPGGRTRRSSGRRQAWLAACKEGKCESNLAPLPCCHSLSTDPVRA